MNSHFLFTKLNTAVFITLVPKIDIVTIQIWPLLISLLHIDITM